MSIYRLGLDVGQRVDNSAVCVVEEDEGKATVRLLVKYPLGTGFAVLAQTVSELYKSVADKGEVYSFAVDATGIGSAPAQMIQQLLPEARVDFFIFTNKTKRELVGKVKVLHAQNRLKFARRKGDEYYNRTLNELIQEMKSVQAKVIREDPTNPEIEVFKTGTHDDLFTALALAVKDIRLDGGAGLGDIGLIPDRSWTRTPLDEPAGTPEIFLTG